MSQVFVLLRIFSRLNDDRKYNYDAIKVHLCGINFTPFFGGNLKSFLRVTFMHEIPQTLAMSVPPTVSFLLYIF